MLPLDHIGNEFAILFHVTMESWTIVSFHGRAEKCIGNGAHWKFFLPQASIDSPFIHGLVVFEKVTPLSN